MDDFNDPTHAFLEKRDAERVSAKLQIKFQEIAKEEAERVLTTGDFTDIFVSSHLGGEVEEEGLKDALTENVSISGLNLIGDIRLVGGKALGEGAFLVVEIQVPDAPIPVRTLAMVMWSEADHSDPVVFRAGLFFVGINRQDVMKMARFVVLQRRAKQ
jgi:hypothetical protein